MLECCWFFGQRSFLDSTERPYQHWKGRKGQSFVPQKRKLWNNWLCLQSGRNPTELLWAFSSNQNCYVPSSRSSCFSIRFRLFLSLPLKNQIDCWIWPWVGYKNDKNYFGKRNGIWRFVSFEGVLAWNIHDLITMALELIRFEPAITCNAWFCLNFMG